MSEKIKLVFLGTPEFATPFLEQLHSDHRFELTAVITQEDKPAGRKKILTPSSVKETAQHLGIPVYQPPKLNKAIEILEHLEKVRPDFLVVVAFGQILNQRVLQIPIIQAINVHGSILPKYRGASPIEQAILNDDEKTGLSIMSMGLTMDTGPVYDVIETDIFPEENHLSLRQRLSQLGSKLLPELLIKIKTGQLTSRPQDESKASYCQKISKQDGLVDPQSLTAQQIYNRFRAYYGWPGIYLDFQGKTLKLLSISMVQSPKLSAGKYQIDEKRLFLGCLEGTLEILELQLAGKTAQTSAKFLSGNQHLFDQFNSSLSVISPDYSHH